jgi:hypothetical protein
MKFTKYDFFSNRESPSPQGGEPLHFTAGIRTGALFPSTLDVNCLLDLK